jgi:hypothetical protein
MAASSWVTYMATTAAFTKTDTIALRTSKGGAYILICVCTEGAFIPFNLIQPLSNINVFCYYISKSEISCKSINSISWDLAHLSAERTRELTISCCRLNVSPQTLFTEGMVTVSRHHRIGEFFITNGTLQFFEEQTIRRRHLVVLACF